ncbi:head-tail adaptor protein [Cronobacter sakazakii]|nr:head-tail adaptor protein [Cronobacter sakazakii]
MAGVVRYEQQREGGHRGYPGIPVTTGWRAVHLPPTGGGEIYDIKSAISAENGTRLELLCEKGVKQ